MTRPHVKLNISQAKAAIQKPRSPGTTVRMVTHRGGLRIPKPCSAHYTGQLNIGCRRALRSAPTATHQLHQISPHLPKSGGGPSWVAEKNPTDTLLVSFEGTVSTSLSSKEEVPAFKGRQTLLGWGPAPRGWEGVCSFTIVCHFCPTPSLCIILMRLLAAPPPCRRSPPPLHLSVIARRSSNS